MIPVNTLSSRAVFPALSASQGLTDGIDHQGRKKKYILGHLRKITQWEGDEVQYTTERMNLRETASVELLCVQYHHTTNKSMDKGSDGGKAR